VKNRHLSIENYTVDDSKKSKIKPTATPKQLTVINKSNQASCEQEQTQFIIQEYIKKLKEHETTISSLNNQLNQKNETISNQAEQINKLNNIIKDSQNNIGVIH